MNNFLKKHAEKLKAAALILMLVTPFFLHTAAVHGTIIEVKLFLALMVGTMLFVLKKG